MNQEDEKKLAYKVSLVSIAVNIILSIVKAAIGICGHSKALISDAIHSVSDIFSTIVVIIGFRLSRKETDSDHPYGHERMECVAAVLLATMLAVTGGILGESGIISLIKHDYNSKSIPGILTIFAAILSIVIKEGMFWYTRHAAKKINSDSLMADAWHHRSDAFSSVGSLIGILFARNGFPAGDSIACIIISILILKAAIDIYMDSFRKMVDHCCDDETVNKIYEDVMSVDGVKGIHTLKTRMFGSKIYVDIELYVDGHITLFEAHDISEAVHNYIESMYPEIKHCMIHAEPAEQKEFDEENEIKETIRKLNG